MKRIVNFCDKNPNITFGVEKLNLSEPNMQCVPQPPSRTADMRRFAPGRERIQNFGSELEAVYDEIMRNGSIRSSHVIVRELRRSS